MSVFTPEIQITNVPDVTVSAGVAVNNFPATQPVSGTVTVANPGLTDTQLRASAVPVSGPLTDTQLRATPVPVAEGAKSTAVVTNATVTAVVSTVLTAVSTRSKFVLYNETGTLFVKLGTGASATSYSQRLTANTSWEFAGYSGIVTVIKASGSSALLVTSVE